MTSTFPRRADRYAIGLKLIGLAASLFACNTFATTPSVKPIPTRTPTGTAVTPLALSAGYSSTCALMSNQTIRCWGANDGGQLGGSLGGHGAMARAVPVLENDGSLLSHVTQVSMGNHHACAIVSGAVKCWGSNTEGQLGIGTTDPEGIVRGPTWVNHLTFGNDYVVEIAAGKDHTCALLSTAVVKCWGDNHIEQSGQINPTAPNMAPVTLPLQVDLGGATAYHIASGSYHTCASTTMGTQCWGLNAYGELGRDTGWSYWDMPAASATDIEGVRRLVTSPSADHTCAGRTALPYACWGRNEFGQRGDGMFGSANLWDTTEVMYDPGFQDFAAGALNSCGVYNHLVYCTGSNGSGQLTQSGIVSSNVPVLTTVPAAARKVAVGAGHVCATVGNRVMCWGSNEEGALGRNAFCDNTPQSLCSSPNPAFVSGINAP